MDFNTFKLTVVDATGLAKDALHIYVGIGVYLLCLIVLRPMLKSYNIRAFIGLIMVLGVALSGEYLDNRHIIVPKGIFALGVVDITSSIHDLINTCLLPFVLYALTTWTKIFHTPTKAAPMIKRHKKTDY